MGVYKVIQDIEAEDKLVGPLTLRQFIFALIGVLFYYLSFLVVAKHATIMLLVFLPPALIASFFAWPWSADQPTEIWALAKIRFYFKPHRRIWDQSGVKHMVTITVPKKVAEPMRTNGLSQREVNSRLGALASTIDSRGWAIKNVNINLSAQPTIIGNDDGSDRLVAAGSFPQEVPNYEIQAADDILDEHSNPIAQQFDQMINAATKAHRQELVHMMSQSPSGPSLPAPVGNTASATSQTATTPSADESKKYWFLNRPEPGAAQQRSRRGTSKADTPARDTTSSGMVVAATPTAEEEALGRQIKAEHQRPNEFAGRMKTIQPLGSLPDDTATSTTSDDATDSAKAAAASPPLPPQPDPAILQLATNNDLNVATLARQAHKRDDSKGELKDNEVVISLH